MPKINLETVDTPLNSHEFQAQINENFRKVSEKLDEQLQRVAQDGVENAMATELDMGSNRIINVGKPVNPGDAARKHDVDSLSGMVEQWANVAKGHAEDAEGFADEAKEARTVAISAANSAREYAKESLEHANTSLEHANASLGYSEDARDYAQDAADAIEAAKQVMINGEVGDLKTTFSKALSPGCVWADGSTYHVSAYPVLLKKFNQNAVVWVPFEEFQNRLDQYGSCGAFAYNATTGEFRVPLLNGVFFQASLLPYTIGYNVAAGLPALPSHTHNIISTEYDTGIGLTYGNALARATGGDRDYNLEGSSEGVEATLGKTSTPSTTTNAIYGRSTTVQPPAIKMRYYVVLQRDVASLYKPHPSVNTYADLPTEGNERGDVRVVLESGVSYAWVDSATPGTFEWTSLGVLTEGSSQWGSITGTLSAQADLQARFSLTNRQIEVLQEAKQDKMVNRSITIPAEWWYQSVEDGLYYMGLVTVTGVTLHSNVWVAPDSSTQENVDIYTKAGVVAIGQEIDALRFRASSMPTGAVQISVIFDY